ncbi:MAG: hypothetical protein GOMPHAMPRED_007212 [Gomphillus americanus]|uniref:Galactose oxidase n=1 Tax=Gomphillus americanus TaxID=1940652 RepID=A0A8H3EV50_9LECA|nr:MAG: hypothetical protein GOMPHAMPRED_007212 [Gomphillus americanus]
MLSRLLSLLLFQLIHAIQLPYNPSTALLSSDSSAVYLLLPNQDGTSFQLDKINLTSTISANGNNATVVASSLPFAPEPTTALIASIDARNKIYLIAGDCENGASASQLWTIQPDDVNAQWIQVQVNASGVQNSSANGGINMLSGAIHFDDNVYVFGGTCPNSTALAVNNWQESGSYSNALLSISSTGTISQLVTRGPPTAEAGFSMTPLEAAYLGNSSSVISQQNFVLVGGQTQTAFINMSQVALFSLPGESWSFASVNTPSNLMSIERSGHAAALSGDGKTVFVFGGWIGDINTAADPQFLSLNIGSDYGGSSDWSWSTPNQMGNGPSLYGHSMLLLPPDVLMISGGYSLSTDSSELGKRDATSNTVTYFFNTTSSTWVTDYTNPDSAPSPTPVPSNNKLALGLGLGLGLGLALLLILCLGLWFGRRKIREHRRNRNRRLLQQSMNAANGPEADTEPVQWMMERNRTGADPYPWAPAPGDIDSVRRVSTGERSGVVCEAPTPTRGFRRSLHSRPTSHRYEDSNRNRATGHIHTIAESDENEKSPDHDVIAEAPPLNPFQDPPPHLLDRRSPSPTSPAHEREREMQHWHNDWAEAERHQTSGRTSPNKSDRTTSSLSDSNRSVVSALSYQPSLRRDGSKRSDPQVSPPDSPITSTHTRQRSRSFVTSTRTPDTPSSFTRLQAEGQALLGGLPSSSRPPSRTKTFLGTVRRALAGNTSFTSAPERSATTAGNSSNRNSIHNGLITRPQRSASLGAPPLPPTYIQHRQGAQDWDATPSPTRSIAEEGFVGDEDWDVESAVERRVVQVMFTVPRGSLRVVNAGPDGDGASLADAEVVPLIESVGEGVSESTSEAYGSGNGSGSGNEVVSKEKEKEKEGREK